MISSTRWCLVMLISMMLFVGSSASWTPANYHVVDDDYPLYDSDEGYGDWRIHKVSSRWSRIEKDAEIYERYLMAKIKKDKEEDEKRMAKIKKNKEERMAKIKKNKEEAPKKFKCILPNDVRVAYRKSKNGAKTHTHVKGDDVVDAVLIDGNWFQARNGRWLPIELGNGQVLFKEYFSDVEVSNAGTRETNGLYIRHEASESPRIYFLGQVDLQEIERPWYKKKDSKRLIYFLDNPKMRGWVLLGDDGKLYHYNKTNSALPPAGKWTKAGFMNLMDKGGQRRVFMNLMDKKWTKAGFMMDEKAIFRHV